MTARCPVRGCPVRYSSGQDRNCGQHADSGGDLAEAAATMGIELAPRLRFEPGHGDDDS